MLSCAAHHPIVHGTPGRAPGPGPPPYRRAGAAGRTVRRPFREVIPDDLSDHVTPGRILNPVNGNPIQCHSGRVGPRAPSGRAVFI
eukprot:214886-Hanusia_phi.AAC.1